MNTLHSLQRFKIVAAVHLFLIKDNTIFLIRRFNTGYRDGEYSVIAGHVDGNEKITHAMIREAQEEAGIDIESKNLNLVHVMHRKTHEERVDFFFTTATWSGNPTITEKDKCDDMRWFHMTKLPENVVPYVRCAIKNYKEGIFYSEFGWKIPDEE